MILSFFFFNDTATTEIYTLSLHDALPIFDPHRRDDGAEAPHLALRLEVRARLEPGRLAGGQRVASFVGGAGDVLPPHAPLRHAAHVEAAGPVDHVFVRRLEQLRGDPPPPLA